MPRLKARPLFELGGQWIAAEPGRPGLYRFWNDAGTGRTRRASLGTADIEEAKSRLAEIVVQGAPKTGKSYLTVILENYFVERTDHLASAKAARHAGAIILECWGDLTKASDITDLKQKEFAKWSAKKGHALSYCARNLGVLAAAIEHANLRAKVIYNEGEILAKWPDITWKAARRIFIPTDAELARVLKADITEDFRRWLLNAMATGGRPEAVLELAPAVREREYRLIDLNPQGRRQNKKFRPKVREPKVMTAWLDKWEKKGLKEHGGRYCGYASVDSVDSAIQRFRVLEEVNLPQLSVYSIRHKVTTVLRAAKVPAEQISYQLGHRRSDLRVTGDYGEYDPGYLAEASAALDAWIRRVLKLAQIKTGKGRKTHRKPTPASHRRGRKTQGAVLAA